MKQIEYIVTCTYDDKKVFSKAYHGELIRCINCRYHEEVLRLEGDHNFIDDMCTVVILLLGFLLFAIGSCMENL